MEFSVPQESSTDVDLQLTRLAKDFHDGYLTEKGYIKKRMELLGMTQGSVSETGSHSYTTSDTNKHTKNNSLHSVTTTSSVGNHANNSNSDIVNDFWHPGHQISSSVDEASGSQPAFYRDEMIAKYKNIQANHDYEFRKELQKPLDPRDVSSHIEPRYEVSNLAMILRKRAKLSEREPAVLIIDERGKESKVITWDKLYYRAEKISKQIKNKAALYPGDRLCLIYQNIEIIDFMAALYGCFLAGVVAVPLNSSTPTRDMVSIMNETQSHLCLMSDSAYKFFDKLARQTKSTIWPKGMVVWKTSDMGTYKPSKKDGDPALKVSDLAYIDYTKTASGEYKGVVISHRTIMNQMVMMDKMLSTSPKIKKPLVRSTIKQSSSRNTILSTLDVRGSIGMIMSLFAVYSGNLLVCIPASIAEVPGLFASSLSSYHVSVVLTDYALLKTVVYNYQSFPQSTRTFSKRKIDLSCINWCLIDTFTIDCEFNEVLSNRWLKPLGSVNFRRIVTPILSLSEHGGAIISMRDWYGNEEQLGCIFSSNSNVIETDEFGDDDSSDRLSEILIDKNSLSTNSVKVINDSPPNVSSSESKSNINYIRVGAFGYPLPDSTLAIVNPENKILSGVLEVGEIWVDSNCISGGYWGLPEETEDIFQAECSDYDGVLSLRFVRTGLLGFIYNGEIYVLGLYEDRINQRVTWYDQYLALNGEDTKTDNDEATMLSKVLTSDVESVYKQMAKKMKIPTNDIDLSQSLSKRYVYKYHYSSHLVKTLARHLPFFKDCAFFNLKVNSEYLPVGVMESGVGGDSSAAAQIELQSMISEAFSLLEKHHNVRLFFMVVTKVGTLSRSMKSGRMEIANTLTKRKFLEGRLPSLYVSFKPYNSLGTIYHNEDMTGSIWSAYSSLIRAELLDFSSLQTSGLDLRDSAVDERTQISLSDFKDPISLLEFRANKQSDELAYAQIEGIVIKVNKPLTTWKKFESKVFSICSYILEKKVLKAGDAVVLMYPLGEELLSCLYACWMSGFIVIPMDPSCKDNSSTDDDAIALAQIIKEYKVKAIFVNNETESLIKTKSFNSKLKTAASRVRCEVPKLRNTTKHAKTGSSGKSTYRKMEQYRKNVLSKEKPFTVWLNTSPNGNHTSTKVSCENLMQMCLSIKETCQMKSSIPLLGCSNYTSGIGFLLGCVMGVYLGTTTYLMNNTEFTHHTNTFFQAIERYRIENVHLDDHMLLYALKRNSMKKTDLKCMKNLMVSWAGQRPDPMLTMKYKEVLDLANIRLKTISNVYDHILHPLVSTRSYLSFDPVILWLDPYGLSQGYISIVNHNDSPNSIPVIDSGIVSVNTEVIIVNPETKNICKVGEFGEIWISSSSMADGFAGKDSTNLNTEMLGGKIEISDKEYVRTGDFGFLHTITKNERNIPVEMQLLYNLGKIHETFEYCGLQYFASDVEHSLETFDGINKCCVFKAGVYTILVAATSTKRSLSTITPLMILKLLNKVKLVVDIVSFVDADRLPITRTGRVQRSLVADRWLKKSLSIKATYGVSYGEEQMIKAVNMQEWVEERLDKLK